MEVSLHCIRDREEAERQFAQYHEEQEEDHSTQLEAMERRRQEEVKAATMVGLQQVGMAVMRVCNACMNIQ